MKCWARMACLGALMAMASAASAIPITGSIMFYGNGTYDADKGWFAAGGELSPSDNNSQVNSATGTLNLLGFGYGDAATFFSFSTAEIGAGESVFSLASSGGDLAFALNRVYSGSENGFVATGTLIMIGGLGAGVVPANFTLTADQASGTFIGILDPFSEAPVAVTPEPRFLALLGICVTGCAGLAMRRRPV